MKKLNLVEISCEGVEDTSIMYYRGKPIRTWFVDFERMKVHHHEGVSIAHVARSNSLDTWSCKTDGGVVLLLSKEMSSRLSYAYTNWLITEDST